MYIKNNKKWSADQLTREQAIAFAESGIWKDWTPEQIVRFQLFQARSCMDFGHFQHCLETVLGRSVWTHELANRDAIALEYLGEKPAPRLDEIIEIIPADKRVLIGL